MRRFLINVRKPLLPILFAGATLALPGCVDDTSDPIPELDELVTEQAADPVLDALSNAGNWERRPDRVPLADGPNDDAFQLTEAQLDEAEEAARQDPTWYSADGERYEAMYVLPDGTAYGRRGSAPTAVAPNASNKYGAFEGTKTDPIDDSGSGQGGIFTVVTNDNRFRYQLMTGFPLRTNGNMSFDGTTAGGACSGTKIGPRNVITASHCVLNQNGGWTVSGTFNPGQTNTTTPNGSYAWNGVYARDWRVHRQYDYAVFFVNDSQAFYNLGWLGVAWWNDASGYTGRSAQNRGYPCGPNNGCGAITNQRCAASARADLRCDGWMYGMTSTLTSSAYYTGNLLSYNNDVSQGHSGSAIFDVASNAVLAVVTHQEPPTPSTTAPCHGPRFRQSMWDDVCSWIADPNLQSAFGQHSLCHP